MLFCMIRAWAVHSGSSRTCESHRTPTAARMDFQSTRCARNRLILLGRRRCQLILTCDPASKAEDQSTGCGRRYWFPPVHCRPSCPSGICSNRLRLKSSAYRSKSTTPIVPVPELPSDLAFPLEVIQYNQPNINAAKNQCVPMADALVIGYLRIRYNHAPLAWPLPHFSSAGLGLQTTSGDVIAWQPEPESSRVAQLDARARRSGVLNFDTGGGTDRCNNIRAVFSYMATQGVPGQIVFRHQGGSATYGAGNSCDNG